MRDLASTSYDGILFNIRTTIMHVVVFFALLNQDNIFYGTVTAAGFAGNGGGLTSSNANNLSSGTLADVRLSANVARLEPRNTRILRDDGTAFSQRSWLVNCAQAFQHFCP